MVVQYVKVIAKRSLLISKAMKFNQYEKISELIPYIQGLFWADEFLKLKSVNSYRDFVFLNFSGDVGKLRYRLTKVDKKLQNCFET